MPGNRAVFEAAMKRAAEHAWSQRWDLALSDYERAAHEFPDDIAARGNLALAHFRLGNWDQALAHYTWMLEHAPENTFVLDRLIEVYRKLGRYSDAKQMQARLNVLNQRPRGTGGLAPAGGVDHAPTLAGAFAADKTATGDLTGGRPARRTKEELVALAIACEEEGRVDEAVQHYEQAISAGLDRADVYYALGLLYQQQNEHKKALIYFERCLDDADYAMSATYGCGVSRRAAGDVEDAARMLSLAISLIDHSQIRAIDLEELITIYSTAIETLNDVGNFLQASNLAASLADFLNGFDGHAEMATHFRSIGQVLTDNLTASLVAARTNGEVEPILTEPATAEPAGVEPIITAVAAAEPATVEAVAVPAITATTASVAAPVSRPAAPTAVVKPEPSVAQPNPVAPAPLMPTRPGTRSLPPVGPQGTAILAPARHSTGPLPDTERPERLSTSYRRMTGPLGAEPRRGTTVLAEETDGSSAARKPASGPLTPPPPMNGRHRIRALSPVLPGLIEQPEAIQTLANEADDQARAGQVLGAIDAYYAIITQAPDFVPAHLRLAELHALSGQYARAHSTTQTALRLLTYREAAPSESLPFLRLITRIRPSDDVALATYIECAHQAGQVVQAAPLIRRLVQRLLKRGATNRALAEAERLAAALPGDETALLHHARTLLLVGQPEPALQLYRQILATQPRHLPAITGANVAFALLGHDAAWWLSLETMVEAARLAPEGYRIPLRLFAQLHETHNLPHVRACAGILLHHTGRHREARQWLNPVLTDNSVEPRLRAVILHTAALSAAVLQEIRAEIELRRATLGLLANTVVGQAATAVHIFDHPFELGFMARAYADLLARQGEMVAAIQSLEAARRLSPGDTALLNQLADFYLQAGRLSDALNVLDALAGHERDAGRLEAMAAVLDRMSALAPNNIAVKTKLIDAFLQRGFITQARRELELRAQLQESSGKVTDAITSLQKAADIAFTTGLLDDAFDLAERMVALQPSNVDARQYLMTLRLQHGQVEQAVEQAWALANMHIAASNHRDAIAALHQVIGLAPSDTKAHHRLGEALAAIGEYAQAERVYQRLMRDDPHDAMARARHTAMSALVSESNDDAA